MIRLVSLILYLISSQVLAQALAEDKVTVAISDNIIVIDGTKRSGTIDLVNGSSDAVIFSVYPLEESIGIKQSLNNLLRWAPQSGLAPAHRSLPFRVLARPTPNLAPGEYAMQFGVRSEVQKKNPPIIVNAEDELEEPSISVSATIIPVIPITVYYRHQIPTPKVDIEPFRLTPADQLYLGYVSVTKRMPNVSFVGQIQLEDRATGRVVNSGRLHLAQQGVSAKVRISRVEETSETDREYCIKVWDHFPAERAPYINECSD